ncbi:MULTISPECIES: AAA family ATPase [Protofrankia]|uniref:AAA ATPase n=1 Tax=Candidatus Protofrankia datiscae TaxID=2716812 RepID=F8AXN1_9ACTN|nr:MULTISPECIES: adenylate/guanylate cyclase domain-containing protein [Protofrankia]AEH10387.1 AAA ATPase [Candidatus Protofrankia datiscae]
MAVTNTSGAADQPGGTDEAAVEPGPRIRLVTPGSLVDQNMLTDPLSGEPSATGTVTLLFTDIEGSTRLVRRHGERYGDILAACQRLQRQAFAANNGREIDTQGDSFFVAFRTSKDAVAAAVAAQRALAAHQWPAGARVRVRMGLHTTEPTAWTGRFVGLGVHRAARLCAAGHGGQILLSEITHSLVEDALPDGLDMRYLGEHWLKDFDQTQRIWQLAVPGLQNTFPPLRAPDASASAGMCDETAAGTDADDDADSDSDSDSEHSAGSHLGWLASMADAAFVGRVTELRALRESWERARSGHRVLALVSGEPGIGKTTLAARIARIALDDGGLVLYGRWDEDVLAPYQAYREALSEYSRTCPRSVLRAEFSEHADEISRLFPEVAKRIGVVGTPLPGNAEAERFRLFEAIDGWLGTMAARRPVLTVLDDLQWADRSSLLLLQHITRALRATPLLVVATYRSTDHGELSDFLPRLVRDVGCRRITVDGLDDDETVALLGRITGGGLSGPDLALARELRADTAGNPFFLTEMMRHLVDMGTLFPAPLPASGRAPSADPAVPAGLPAPPNPLPAPLTPTGPLQPDRPLPAHLADLSGPPAPSQVEIPETVRDLVRWRLSRLSRECAAALDVASVIGHEFDVDILSTATRIDEMRLLDLLDEAQQAGLVHEDHDQAARYVFSHSVVRRFLRDNLGLTRAARLHRRIGDAFQDRQASAHAELAHHYWASADPAVADRAVHYARLAGDRALAEAAFDGAVLHYRRALDVLDRNGGGLRAELLLALGDAHGRAGEYPARDARFLEAAAAARSSDSTDLFTRAAFGYGGVLPPAVSPDPQGRALLEEALQRLGTADSPARARALGRLAHWIHHERPYAERVALCREAIAMARRVRDLATLATVLRHRCWALDGPRDVDEQLVDAAEILRLGEELGNHELLLDGLRIKMSARFRRGEFELAADTAATLTDLARELRHPEFLRIATMWNVVVATIEGRYGHAQRLAGELQAHLRQLGHSQIDLIPIGQALPMLWLQGRLADTRSLIDDIATLQSHIQIWPAMRAWLGAESGADDQVRQLLGRLSPDAPARLDENYSWWATIVAFIQAATAVGEQEWAGRLYDLVLPFARHNATLGLAGFLGAVTHHLGVLAGTLGRWDAACAHFEAALERHQTMGSVPFVALTQTEYALVLTARGCDGDRERAEGLRAAALRTAAELDLKAIRTRAARQIPPGA